MAQVNHIGRELNTLYGYLKLCEISQKRRAIRNRTGFSWVKTRLFTQCRNFGIRGPQSVKVGVLGKPKEGRPPQGGARGFGEFGPLCTEGRWARTSPEVRAVACVWGSPPSAPAPCPTCGCPKPHEAGGGRLPLSKYDPPTCQGSPFSVRQKPGFGLPPQAHILVTPHIRHTLAPA